MFPRMFHVQVETHRRYNFKDAVLRFYHIKTYIRSCTPSEDSDHSADLFCLIRIFTGHSLDSQGCKVSSCGQRRLLSNSADAQADLSFPWCTCQQVRFHKSRLIYVHDGHIGCHFQIVSAHERSCPSDASYVKRTQCA